MKFFRVGNDWRFVVSVVFSLLTITGGIVWTYRVGQTSNNYGHRLGHLVDGLKDLQTTIAQAEMRR